MKINKLKQGGVYILLLFSILFFSCQNTLRIITGASKPKHESKESIINWLKSKDLKYERSKILYFTDTNVLLKALNKIEKVPSFMIFNKKGLLLNDPNTCFSVNDEDKNQFNVAVELKNEFLFQSSDTLTFDFFKNKTYSLLDGTHKINNKNSEYVVLFFWAKYLGKKINNKIFEEVKILKDSSIDYDYYLINLDVIN